jgi:hypothetical protein
LIDRDNLSVAVLRCASCVYRATRLRLRDLVERIFGKKKHFRAVATASRRRRRHLAH